MILYHGTSSRFIHDILEHGIKCRREKDSLWLAHPSCADRVYLTNAYAVFFAKAAADDVGGQPMILEVDVSDRMCNLVPDEDVMGQVEWADLPELRDMSLKQCTEYWKLRTHELHHFADFSLEQLGTVAHMGDIPAEDINTHLVLDWENPAIIGHDPMISLQNFKILGADYQDALATLVNTKGQDGWSPY